MAGGWVVVSSDKWGVIVRSEATKIQTASAVTVWIFALLAMMRRHIPRYAAWTCLLLASSPLEPCMMTLPLSST